MWKRDDLKMSDTLPLLMYMKNMIADLIFLNSVIATELIKITENTAAIRHGEDFLKKSSCISEHDEINKEIIEIMKKYKSPPNSSILEKHVLKHDSLEEK